MPQQLRGARGSSVETPALLIGCILAILVVLGFFQQQLRRRRRNQFHPPLQLETSSRGVLSQIGRRKQDLNRFIDKLKAQLAAREQQLLYHNQLEEIVTSRVETDRRDDEEWEQLMKAGRKVHGKKWNATDGEKPSLRELMELHKDELLEYKRSTQPQLDPSRHHSGKSHPKKTFSRTRQSIKPAKFSRPLLELQQIAPLPSNVPSKPASPKLIPPQWQSTRRIAGSSVLGTASTHAPIPSLPPEPVPSMVVPKLDFSRLGGAPTAPVLGQAADDGVSQKKKSFEDTFQRQTRLAAMLRKKK